MPVKRVFAKQKYIYFSYHCLLRMNTALCLDISTSVKGVLLGGCGLSSLPKLDVYA